jgi:hypothetical protein
MEVQEQLIQVEAEEVLVLILQVEADPAVRESLS